MFKIYDSDFGVKINGIAYEFTDVMSITVEDPQTAHIVRGSNGKNTLGIAYREGMKDPNKWTVEILNMSIELKELLDDSFEDETRMDVYCISRKTGASKMAKDAILCQKPQQLKLDESQESLYIQLVFETFDSSEVYK